MVLDGFRLGTLIAGLVVGCIAPAWSQSQPAGETPIPASEFANSVGINIHLSYDQTLYFQNFPLIRAALLELGVHHVRDGLLSSPFPAYYERCRQLAGDGVRFDLIVSPDQTPTQIAAASSSLGSSLESLEAPNEFDLTPKPWVPKLRDFLPRLYAAGKSLKLPVVGPSLTQGASYAELSDVSAFADFGNLHNYFGGHHPGSQGWGDDAYGSYAWNLKKVALTTPGLPVVTTETGYTNQTTIPGHLSEAMVARYVPRLLLEQWAHGIHRTYLYELLSSGGEDYGLLRADGTRKPAFLAVSTLTRLFNDPGPAGVVRKVPFRVEAESSAVHHLLFRKRDGTLLLALWVEASSFDVDRQEPVRVSPETVTVDIGLQVKHLESVLFTDAGDAEPHALQAARRFQQTVDDHLVVLHIKPRS